MEENDRFLLNDEYELPRIRQGSPSISHTVTGPFRDGDSHHDEPSDSSKSTHLPTQNQAQQRSIPGEPILGYESPSKPNATTDNTVEVLASSRGTSSDLPRPLEPYSFKKRLGLLMELLVCLAPVAFLILAGLAKGLDGREISGYGKNIHEWTLLSPTIFPLVFAAVVGLSLRNVARYKLERGCRLQHVEQFIGSQSVFGAIYTQLRLQLVDVTGIALILLWLISPLGGQASLRLLSTRSSAVITTTQIGFANLTNSSSQLFDDLQSRIYERTFNGLYTAGLIAPLDVKQSPQDPWGNLKIPVFETLSGPPDDAGFKTISDDNQTDWASLIGLPVTGLLEGAQVNSIIPAQYYYTNCSRIYGVDGTKNWPATELGLTGYNNTNIWMSVTGSADFVAQWLVSFGGDYKDGWPKSSQLTMTFASWSGDSMGGDGGVFYTANATIAKCTIEPSFIDIQMVCEGLSCRAAAARRSSRVRPTNSSDSASNLAWWGWLLQETGEAQRDFSTYWTTANSAPDTGQIAPTLVYIGGSEAFPFVAPGGGIGGQAPSLYNLELDAFNRRMRRLFNTYWQSSIGPPAYNGTIPRGDPAAFLSGKTANDSNLQYQMTISPAGATVERNITIFHTEPWWLTITIVASCILLLTGLLGFGAKCMCIGPDLLTSFTTALRASPQTAPYLRDNNSTFDSSEVAKANKSLMVALQDVRPDQPVGLVALSADRSAEGIANVRRRDRRRLYN